MDSRDVVLSPHLAHLEPKDVWGPGPGEVRRLVCVVERRQRAENPDPLCGVRRAMRFPCLPPCVQVGRTHILPSRKG